MCCVVGHVVTFLEKKQSCPVGKHSRHGGSGVLLSRKGGIGQALWLLEWQYSVIDKSRISAACLGWKSWLLLFHLCDLEKLVKLLCLGHGAHNGSCVTRGCVQSLVPAGPDEWPNHHCVHQACKQANHTYCCRLSRCCSGSVICSQSTLTPSSHSIRVTQNFSGLHKCSSLDKLCVLPGKSTSSLFNT
jgi:hypothetical protein